MGVVLINVCVIMKSLVLSDHSRMQQLQNNTAAVMHTDRQTEICAHAHAYNIAIEQTYV